MGSLSTPPQALEVRALFRGTYTRPCSTRKHPNIMYLPSCSASSKYRFQSLLALKFSSSDRLVQVPGQCVYNTAQQTVTH
jgi:hypothetical protein